MGTARQLKAMAEKRIKVNAELSTQMSHIERDAKASAKANAEAAAKGDEGLRQEMAANKAEAERDHKAVIASGAKTNAKLAASDAQTKREFKAVAEKGAKANARLDDQMLRIKRNAKVTAKVNAAMAKGDADLEKMVTKKNAAIKRRLDAMVMDQAVTDAAMNARMV